ncbi:MAG: DNA topoisomerase 4 subunit B [Lysobacterales bacterium]|jgi:topoisomerase-4 subunit B|nr:MAG: DNA topoisomerase 4 subunit B [Xanthomonadales bacterium]
MSRYVAADIEVLSGLQPVRRRPGMYTDTSRPNHLVMEVVDNAVDEALAGYAKRIEVRLFADGSIEVEDDGRGMPVDLHPEEGLSGVELILTRLHAGGKFSRKNYSFAGGLHGVGVSVVNALSKRLVVHVWRDGQEWRQEFADGEPLAPLSPVAAAPKRKTGTRLRFWPDPQFFDSPKVAVPRLEHLLRAKAVLCPGLEIRLWNEAEGSERCWLYRDGLRDYLLGLLAPASLLPAGGWHASLEREGEAVEFCLAWLPEGELVQESYVNLIPTPQGGTHVSGLRAGLTEALREFIALRDLAPRGLRIAPEDLWERLSFVLSLKIHEPQFSGQTKERLSSRQAAALVESLAHDAFSLWLHQHVAEGEAIAALVIERAQSRLRREKVVTRKKVGAGPALPGKLADCTESELSRSELFIVEGDSAGGSAKQARDKSFQAILPLRGKILNTWEVEPQNVLASAEVHDLAVAIGCDPGSRDLSGLRYGKIIILADADADGLHIATLLCALFLKHFPALVERGHVYVAMPPLYRIDIGKQVFYALDDEEKRAILARAGKAEGSRDVQITRFKGLGEMNPAQLRESTMDPRSRRLIRLTLDDPAETEALMDLLLGKRRAAERRHWLESKGDLASLEV